jgi:hypothetical protein
MFSDLTLDEKMTFIMPDLDEQPGETLLSTSKDVSEKSLQFTNSLKA